MKSVLSYSILFLCFLSVHAQPNLGQKMLSIEEAVLKQRSTLAPERLQQLQWIPGTHSFAYIAKKGEKECIVVQNVPDLKRDTILGIEDFSTAYNNINPEVKNVDKFPPITFTGPGTFRYISRQTCYLFSTRCMCNKV